MKTCSRCQNEKPVSDMKGSWCKPCTSQYTANYRKGIKDGSVRPKDLKRWARPYQFNDLCPSVKRAYFAEMAEHITMIVLSDLRLGKFSDNAPNPDKSSQTGPTIVIRP